jgi:PhnB protein
MQTNPHLHFKGDCIEAFRFYADTFGGRIEMAMTYGESPAAAQTPDDFRDKIIHARVSLNGPMLMGCDAPAERYQKPQGFNVLALVAEPADAERIFASLSQQGQVTMAIQQTFWSQRFGMCTDRFGIPWMVNCEKPPEAPAV